METSDLRELRDQLRLEAKRSRRILPVVVLVGVCFMAVALKVWLVDSEADFLGSFGIIAGCLSGALAVKWFDSTMAQSYSRMPGDPSQEDARSYFQELDDINRRTLRQFQQSG